MTLIGNFSRAFSGEVDAGSPPENAIIQREIERIPILLERNLLYSAIV